MKENMSQDELKKMRRMSYIKMVAMVGIVVAVIAFGSIAWFTMNREVEGTGAQMTAAGNNFTLSMIGDSNGLYYDDYHFGIIDSDAVVWTMSADANDGTNGYYSGNFGNYTQVQNGGIYPGSSGVLSFNITPLVDGDLPLKFTFELLGYNAETEEIQANNDQEDNEDGQNGEEAGEVPLSPVTQTKINMVQLDDEDDADVIGYLNGHILLFENYNSTTHTYSGLISSGEDMTRVLNHTFNGKDIAEQVDIYWVWPLTLSSVVAADNEVDTLCTGTDYVEMEEYVLSNPQCFMKGVTTSQANPLTMDIIEEDYPFYGGRYDQADNIIGARVRYLRLKMTIQ